MGVDTKVWKIRKFDTQIGQIRAVDTQVMGKLELTQKLGKSG